MTTPAAPAPTGQTKPAREWPSREEWARQRRTVYIGDETPARCFEPYRHMVTEAMRTASDDELRLLWRALGRHVRGYRHDDTALNVRDFRATVKEAIEHTWAEAAHAVLRRLDRVDGNILGAIQPAIVAAHALPATRAYVAALRAMKAAADEDFRREVAESPVDDAAWAQELARREKIERYLQGDGMTAIR